MFAPPRKRIAFCLLAIFFVLVVACAPVTVPTAAPAQPTSAPAQATALPQATNAPAQPSAGTGTVTLLPPSPKTHGPNGEKSAFTTDLKLTDDEIAQLKGKNITAAILWPASFQFYKVASQGIRSVLDQVGGQVIAETDSGYNPSRQAGDVETVLARKPTVIFTWLVDPVQETDAFRRALDQGSVLSFLSNLPKGFEHPKDYAAVVTDDLYGMGEAAADAMADTLGKKGNIGWIFHDANSYVTNQRDNAFKEVIQTKYPDIKIVAEGGFADPAQATNVANAMILQHPEIQGIYVPWSVPAAGVVDALRTANRMDVKVVTLDLDPTVAIYLARGESVATIVADVPFEIGRGLAVTALRQVLGKTSEPFYTVPTIRVTKDNLLTAWKESLKEDPPPEVLKEIK